MSFRGLVSRPFAWVLALGVVVLVVPLSRSARAAAPVVTIGPNSVRIQVVSASLIETIDALSRAARFKVTYEGARPTARLFGAEIDTPTVSQTLIRLLDGQNLNYGVVFDLSGTKVTWLMILGVVPKAAGPSGGGASGGRPQPFATPRIPRNDLPPVDDDPAETVEPEPAPETSPAASPSPTGPARGPGQGSQPPFPRSPFAPRPPYGNPFGPRPTPSPSP